MNTVSTLSQATLDKVQDLIRINLDSSRGLKSASDVVKDAALSRFFADVAQRRQRFADELSHYVEMNNEDASDAGSVRGTVHRWWLKLRGELSSGDVHNVLVEAERGEDAIKQRYEDALVETAGSPLNAVLQRQYAEVKHGHDRIREMRDAC